MIKKIIISLILVVVVMLIYIIFKDDKIYYLYLGDGRVNNINDLVVENLNSKNILEVYNTNFVSDNYRTTDLINFIKENQKNSDSQTIQNNIIKADVIVLSIGENDFINNLELSYQMSKDDLYKRFQQYYFDLDILFSNLKDISKEKIFYIGFYNNTKNHELDEFFNYINKTLESLCIKYNIYYIDVMSLLEINDYEFDMSSLNSSGDFKVSQEILQIIE